MGVARVCGGMPNRSLCDVRCAAADLLRARVCGRDVVARVRCVCVVVAAGALQQGAPSPYVLPPHPPPGAGLGLVVLSSACSAATAAVAFLWRAEGGAGLGDILPVFDSDVSGDAAATGRTPPKAALSAKHILGAPPLTPDSTPRSTLDRPPRENAAATYAVAGSPGSDVYAVACEGSSPANPLRAGNAASTTSEDASQAFTALPGCPSPETQV